MERLGLPLTPIDVLRSHQNAIDGTADLLHDVAASTTLPPALQVFVMLRLCQALNLQIQSERYYGREVMRDILSHEPTP